MITPNTNPFTNPFISSQSKNADCLESRFIICLGNFISKSYGQPLNLNANVNIYISDQILLVMGLVCGSQI